MGIRIHPEDLAGELTARIKGTPEAIKRGIRNGCMFGQALLASRTPRFTGSTAARWRVDGSPEKGWSLYNDAPHIGVLELGARPHPVSAEGIAALTRWARLTMGVDPGEAARIANAIAWKIRHKGQKATYFVRDSRAELGHQTAVEIAQELNRWAKERAK